MSIGLVNLLSTLNTNYEKSIFIFFISNYYTCANLYKWTGHSFVILK